MCCLFLVAACRWAFVVSCFALSPVLLLCSVAPFRSSLSSIVITLLCWARGSWLFCFSLRKHAYSNILTISPPKTENFKIKMSDIFQISAQNIDCGYSLEPPRRGGSNEYPQSMFLSRNKKNNVYPCKPQFYYIKLGFKGVEII